MAVSNHPYRDDHDLARMHAFLTDAWGAFGPTEGYFHVGDLLWQRTMHSDFPPAERIGLWEAADGELLGFAWFYPPAAVEVQLHHSVRGEGRIESEMLAWAEERRQAGADEATPPLSTSVFGEDDPLLGIVTNLGFTLADDAPMLCLRRDLAAPIPPPLPAPGFSVRHVAGEAEFAERVAIHRDVWHPSRFSFEAYRNIRALAGYDPELDLVAVAPDGRFAAYALAWPDTVNRTAEFEPVGARVEHRRRGLARAVLLEGLQRMRDRGLQTAVVYCNREPACALYHSVGFHEVNRWLTYRRASGEASY